MLKYEVPNTQIHWQARLFDINNYYFKGVEPQRCTGNLPCHKSNSQPRDINGMRQRRAQPCSSRAPRARAQVMLLGSLTEPPEACEGTVGGCLGLSTVVQCRQLWLRVSQTPKQAQPPPGTVGTQAQENPLGGGVFIFLTARLLKGFLGLLYK